jgi:hypothetical protein
MNRDEPEEASTEREWETLPLPSPVPLTKVQPYDSPRGNSPDPLVLRLYARRSSWAMAAWLSLWPMVLIVMLATPGAPIQPYLIAALFVCVASYGWYRLLLPRCLRIDSEGLEFSGVGAHPNPPRSRGPRSTLCDSRYGSLQELGGAAPRRPTLTWRRPVVRSGYCRRPVVGHDQLRPGGRSAPRLFATRVLCSEV